MLSAVLATVAPARPTRRAAPWRYATREARAEFTLDGVAATGLVCWPHVKQQPCTCDGTCAHLWAGLCGAAVAGALGSGRGCRNSRCRKPHPADALAELIAWKQEANGGRPPALGTVAAPGLRADVHALSRSVVTSAVESAAPARCSLPPHAVLDVLRRRAGDSAHLEALLASPWLDGALEDARIRRLFARDSRSVRKDVSEAWAAVRQVRHALRELGCAADGEGAVLLDVCSGKGMTALCLSYELPAAQVVMLDANGGMELAHCAARPNLRFVQLDLFGRDASATLAACAAGAGAAAGASAGAAAGPDGLAGPAGAAGAAGEAAAAGGARACVAVGVHLCGALSPRLLALAARTRAVDAAVVCPCCLKGSLKEEVRREARRAGAGARGHYPALVEKLAALARDEGGVAGVSVDWDGAMLSPKNAFVRAIKHRPAPPEPG